MKALGDIERRIRGLLPEREEAVSWLKEAKASPQLATNALSAFGRLVTSAEYLSASVAEAAAQLAFRQAVAELDENVAELERGQSEDECPPFAYVTWAWRVFCALQAFVADSEAAAAASRASVEQGSDEAAGEAQPIAVARARFPAAEAFLVPLPAAEPLQLNLVDPLLELAQRETSFVERRRRLLEAARRALLDVQAQRELPGQAVQPRVLSIATQVRALNELEVRGLKPTVSVAHQLRQAVSRRDEAAARAAVEALGEFSRVGLLASGSRRFVAEAATVVRQEPEQRTEQFGRGHPSAFSAALGRGLEAARQRADGATDMGVIERQLVQQRLGAGAEAALARGISSIDGCCELGRSVAPVRAREEQRRMRQVSYPTQTMVLEPATRIEDVARSVISDPRLVVFDFATGRLLARKYLATEVRAASVTTRVTEARYFLLDASDSMMGRIGLFRDSILLSELSSLIEFLEDAGPTSVRPVVYFRYFAEHAEPTRRVATRAEAVEAIVTALSQHKRGGTDVEAALIRTFEEIGRERLRDETLQRAQIVLVTDGLARIDVAKVWKARQRLGDMPVGVSTVALGRESEALKALASAQRRAGQDVFYHYFSEPTIRSLLGLQATDTPSKKGKRVAAGSAAKLASEAPAPAASAATEGKASEPDWQRLDQLVEELLALEYDAELEDVELSAHVEGSLSEVGLVLERDYTQAEQARHEYLRREERVLSRRFDRWFPPEDAPRSELVGGAAGSSDVSPEVMSALEVLLVSVVEVVELLDGSPLQRRYDAIEVFERLLFEAGLPPWLYAQAMAAPSPTVQKAVAALRRIAAARD